MSIESRLKDVEEATRLLRDANRLQGRRVSAAAPSAADVMKFNATKGIWEPESPSTAVAHALDSTTHTDVASMTEDSGDFLRYNGSNWTDSTIQDGDVPGTHSGSAHHAVYTASDARGDVPFVEYIPFGSEPITGQSYAP